jgi:hypothetical protein
MQGYKTEAERLQKSQQQALNDLRAAIPAERLKNVAPIEYDSYGIPKIDEPPQMPRVDPNMYQQFQQQQQQQYQPSMDEIQAAFGERTPPSSQKPNMDASTFFTAPAHPAQRDGQPPPQQQRQAPLPTPVVPQEVKQDNLSYHPVITKLLKNFGLKKDKRHDIAIFLEDSSEKMVYSMVEVTEELQTWALELAKEKITEDGNSTATVYFELLFVCCSVVAIDNTPVWEIFDIKPVGNEVERLANNPFDTPLRMRKIAAKSLATLLWSETRPIADKLLTFYQEVVMGKKVTSSMEEEVEKKVRFVCPIDECSNYEFIIPEPGVTFYCKFHGIPLIETVDLIKESDIPLA